MSLKMRSSRRKTLDISPLLKVNAEQFYGIEYEDFPCRIAAAGMWLIDHQMNLRVFIGDIGLCRIASDCVVVRLAGLEPAAHSLGNCCSIHLSYRRKKTGRVIPQRALSHHENASLVIRAAFL